MFSGILLPSFRVEAADSEWVWDGTSAQSARPRRGQDRKSTRLNSSHLVISYAVFCLKKKQQVGPDRPAARLGGRHDGLPVRRSAAPSACPLDVRLPSSVGRTPGASSTFVFFFSDTAPTESSSFPPPPALPP